MCCPRTLVSCRRTKLLTITLSVLQTLCLNAALFLYRLMIVGGGGR